LGNGHPMLTRLGDYPAWSASLFARKLVVQILTPESRSDPRNGSRTPTIFSTMADTNPPLDSSLRWSGDERERERSGERRRPRPSSKALVFGIILSFRVRLILCGPPRSSVSNCIRRRRVETQASKRASKEASPTVESNEGWTHPPPSGAAQNPPLSASRGYGLFVAGRHL
jgi:hypothetical protein